MDIDDMDINDLDFDELARELTEENFEEIMNEMVAKLFSESPQGLAIFQMGRIIGRLDMVRKMSGIINEEMKKVEVLSNIAKGKL